MHSLYHTWYLECCAKSGLSAGRISSPTPHICTVYEAFSTQELLRSEVPPCTCEGLPGAQCRNNPPAFVLKEVAMDVELTN